MRVAMNGKKTGQTLIERGSVRGEKNPGWRGGVSKWPYNYNWRRTREIVRSVADWKCKCGAFAMDVHHKDFDKKNDSFGNLVALCRKCHREVHPIR